MLICFRDALPQEKKKTDRPPRELIPEDSMKAAGAAVLDGKPVNAVARESGATHMTLEQYVSKSELLQTPYIVCRPVYATTQIFTDEEERTLSNYLLRATKLHYGFSWKTTRPSKETYKHVKLEGRPLLGFKVGCRGEGKRWVLVTNILAGGQC